MAIIFSESTSVEIEEHARSEYPHECCGIMLGKNKRVERVEPATNVNRDRAADRYNLDPAEFNRIDKEAREEGLDVLGIYHSHPDHPSAPSEFDRERGFPYFSYLIVAVHDGEIESKRCWIFEEMDAPFEEEEIKIVS